MPRMRSATLEELAAKGAANVAEPDFIMDIYRENHTKIHELVDEVKKHAKELTKDRRIEISRELDEVSKTELKLMRLANIISEPEAWLEYYEKRDANLTANAPAVPLPQDTTTFRGRSNFGRANRSAI